MQGTCTIGGRHFEWSEERGTKDFLSLLHKGYGIEEADVLRIRADESGFDVVIRIDEGTYAGGIKKRYFGPLLVVGNRFPTEESAVPPGVLLRLRPRITSLDSGCIDSAAVECIVQWCLSSGFQAVRINAMGGIWQGYGVKDETSA